MVNQRTYVYCDGYVYYRKSKWLPWNKRYYVLRNCHVQVFLKKAHVPHRDKMMDSFQIISGAIAPNVFNGLEFRRATNQGEEVEVHAVRVDTRAELVRWLTAFHELHANADKKNKEETPERKVSFYENVRIRTVPNLTPDEIQDLFYTEEDVQQFCINAYSLRSRTGDYLKSFISRSKPKANVN